MRIALVEPYFGGSHRAFAEGLARFSSHDIELFTHSASFWKWRMQGGFNTLAERVVGSVEVDGAFDLAVGTGMLDAARFLGVSRRALGAAPFVLYMHENQLTYPPPPHERPDHSYGMTNWASMAASDLVIFNSEFHRTEWFEALHSLLARFPDERQTRLVAAVRARSRVVAPGIDLRRIDGERPAHGDAPLVLWNQRWEHDKGPEVFAEAVRSLAGSGVDFEVAIAGERFVSDPKSFTDLRPVLGGRLVHFGHADDGEYPALLRAADIVVSTSRQEFFGIGVTEAIYAGAFPILPNGLAYPERLPRSHHERCLYEDAADLSEKIAWAATNVDEARAMTDSLRPSMAAFDWSEMAPVYDSTFEAIVGRG